MAAGGVFVLYTVSGGQLSVIRTDLVQIGLILAGTAAAALGGLMRVGGLRSLAAAVPGGHLSFPVGPGFSPVDLLLLLLVVGSTYIIGPDMLSRVFCSRSSSEARRGVVLAIGLLIPLAVLVTLVGMTARVLFPGGGPESAYPLIAREVLPPALGSLAAIGLLSAFLSSADTTLLTASTIVCMDLLGGPAFRRLRTLRLITALVGAGAVVIGLGAGGIIASLLLGYTIFSGGLFVPVLAGLAGKPLGRRAAAVATLGGGALALGGKLLASDLLVAGGFALTVLVLAADRLLSRRASKAGLPET